MTLQLLQVALSSIRVDVHNCCPLGLLNLDGELAISLLKHITLFVVGRFLVLFLIGISPQNILGLFSVSSIDESF